MGSNGEMDYILYLWHISDDAPYLLYYKYS